MSVDSLMDCILHDWSPLFLSSSFNSSLYFSNLETFSLTSLNSSSILCIASITYPSSKLGHASAKNDQIKTLILSLNAKEMLNVTYKLMQLSITIKNMNVLIENVHNNN
jgi:hypothetical protein